MKKIIALVGMPGAGKSDASNFFRQKKIPVIRFGDITDEALKAKGLELTEIHEKNFRENIRKELGMAAYAIKNETKIRHALVDADIIILDGLRSWEEYEYLRKRFPNFYLLAIYASPEIRHKRLYERKVRNASKEETAKRDVSEIISLHMGPPIALADQLIKNETTLDEFHKQLWQYLEQIKKIKNL